MNYITEIRELQTKFNLITENMLSKVNELIPNQRDCVYNQEQMLSKELCKFLKLFPNSRVNRINVYHQVHMYLITNKLLDPDTQTFVCNDALKTILDLGEVETYHELSLRYPNEPRISQFFVPNRIHLINLPGMLEHNFN